MVRNEFLSVRLHPTEKQMIRKVARDLDISMGEVLRRAFWTVRTLYSSYLRAEDAIQTIPLSNPEEEVTLSDVLKPLPELYLIVQEKIKEAERKKSEKP